MIDIEINKALALAIGWEHIGLSALKEDAVCVRDVDGWWHTFDYRDWNVIGPIAEKYNCFPKHINSMWEIAHYGEIYRADTPQRAIAMAVIQGVRK
jgi:hypothetical protein